MAITKSARKALRVNARKRVFNLRRSKAMKSSVKEVRDLANAGKYEEAKALLSKTQQAIDKAVKRGIIKANTASRKKSRLVAFLKSKTS